MKAPKLPSLFKTPKNKQFDIPSRYYDPRKERLDEIQNRYNKNNTDEEYTLPKERMSFRNTTARGVYGKDLKEKGSFTRLAAIIAVLCGVAYYLIYL